jgi:hypothetical protein
VVNLAGNLLLLSKYMNWIALLKKLAIYTLALWVYAICRNCGTWSKLAAISYLEQMQKWSFEFEATVCCEISQVESYEQLFKTPFVFQSLAKYELGLCRNEIHEKSTDSLAVTALLSGRIHISIEFVWLPSFLDH